MSLGCTFVAATKADPNSWILQGNYGKQTLLWDVLFGTKKPRLETADQYIDWNWHVTYPWSVPRRTDISLMPQKTQKAA